MRLLFTLSSCSKKVTQIPLFLDKEICGNSNMQINAGIILNPQKLAMVRMVCFWLRRKRWKFLSVGSSMHKFFATLLNRNSRQWTIRGLKTFLLYLSTIMLKMFSIYGVHVFSVRSQKYSVVTAIDPFDNYVAAKWDGF